MFRRSSSPAHRRARGLLAVVGAVLTAGCDGTAPPAPPPRTGTTAADELREYAQFVRDVHPAPWRFTTSTAFDAIVTEQAAALGRYPAPTELEVARAFQTVLAPLGDAHVAVTSGTLQPDATKARYLPFLVKEVEGSLLIDAAPDPSLVGATILAVAGVSVDQIRLTLLPLVIRDGLNDVSRTRSFEQEFTKLYHFAYGMTPRYRVTFTAGTADQDVVLSGATFEEVRALGSQRRSAPVAGDPPHDVKQLPFTLTDLGGTTWVRIPSFGSTDQAGYQIAVDAIMANADRSSALVIDLRGNTGGFRTEGLMFLNHVLPQPYRQWTRMTARIRDLPARYRARAIAAFGTDLRLLHGFTAAVDGQYVFEGDPLAALMIPTDSWNGRVLVLIDGLTNSAANELVVALKHQRPDVVLIGEEAGGGCQEHIGELPVVWTTPTFRISILMSLIRLELVPVPCPPGHGLFPDVAVAYSRHDFDAGLDPYVDAVRRALN